MDFSQLCACAQTQYSYLKECVDACALQGRSYEFPNCRMPDGCTPSQVNLGFWRAGEAYLLYLKPAVSYQGNDPRLAVFFKRGCLQRFSSFPELMGCLLALGGGAVLSPTRAEPAQGGFPRLRELLQAAVLGQEQATEAVAFKLYGHICKRAPARPLSLIFYGPTCVGKSELAKALAPALNRFYGETRYQLVWTELNTFTEAHSVYRLTGAPPGYVGYEDQPILEAVRRNPYSVFLFDELDKAHPEILKVFMSILDEGRSSARKEDPQGNRELDFRRCIFLFTTNADLSSANRQLGFSPPKPPAPVLSAHSTDLAQRLFQADEAARRALISSGVLREIAGRFSGLIAFQPLDPAARIAVTARQITALGREYGLEIAAVDPAIAQALTPADSLSLRSTAGVLEGALTPLFFTQAQTGGGSPLRLTGTPDAMRLLPA